MSTASEVVVKRARFPMMLPLVSGEGRAAAAIGEAMDRAPVRLELYSPVREPRAGEERRGEPLQEEKRGRL
jgi:hypothetical protein